MNWSYHVLPQRLIPATMARSRSNSSGSSASSDGSHKHSKRLQKAAVNLAAASVINKAQKLLGDSQGGRGDSSSSSRHSSHSHERSSLLGRLHRHSRESLKSSKRKSNPKIRATVWGGLTLLTVAFLVLFAGFFQSLPDAFIAWLGGVPSDPVAAALVILDRAPVIVSAGYPLRGD